ncbi:MAG: hypothetical protein ABI255_06490 [Microbacteriaceae bacterium]
MQINSNPTSVESHRGSILTGFLDAHVHLCLIDPTPMLANGIARVLDLGGPLAVVGATIGADIPDVAYAGQFLAAPGGYPTDRPWAAPGSVRQVNSGDDAAAAVDTQADAGATVIKVTLNSDAGPVFSDTVLGAVLDAAHARGLPVVAHAEGPGQAERAFAAGVDALAHTPFSQNLDHELVAAMASRMTWISTLDIHRGTAQFESAQHNLRRFHAANGRVLYGTDLGNGPLPVGLNAHELEAMRGAGMTGREVLRALTAPGVTMAADPISRMPRPVSRVDVALPAGRVTFIPGEPPALDEPPDPPAASPIAGAGAGNPGGSCSPATRSPASRSPFTRWLCSARAVTGAELAVIAQTTELTELVP